LTLDSSGNYTGESAWSSGGGGTSAYTPKPSYQNTFSTDPRRDTPDVAYNADPNTGVAVIYRGGLYQFGGTSIGAPQWAGLLALVNQGRVTAGKSTLGTGTTYGTPQTIYAVAASTPSAFHDITTGSNGFPATVGYDKATGLGSPIANLLVPALINS
jgi:subtilase family serine protease